MIMINVDSSINRSNLHSLTKRVTHNGMIMMKVIIKITKTKRSSNQMIALDMVIIDTKKVSGAQPVIQVQNLFKNQTFPQDVFLRDEKQQCIQCIQIVQAHDDQTVILQTSDESFHDANEATSCKLALIKLHLRLGVPPPRAKIITSQADQTSPAAKRVTQGKVVFDEMHSTVHVPSVKPLTTLFRGLLQPCTGALFKRELSVIGKRARYQND